MGWEEEGRVAKRDSMLLAIEETSVLREPSFPSIASIMERLCCTNSVHESAMIGGSLMRSVASE